MTAQTGKMHLEEGIKVPKSGNIRGALMHLDIADRILGRGKMVTIIWYMLVNKKTV
jgi:hypothetical protein